MHAPTPLTRRAAAMSIALCALAAGHNALAQDAWPNKPIRLVVAGPAGGSADALARLLATGLHQQLGQPVIVESKAGASGALAIQDLNIGRSVRLTNFLIAGHGLPRTGP